jgi:hypothetical protein
MQFGNLHFSTRGDVPLMPAGPQRRRDFFAVRRGFDFFLRRAAFFGFSAAANSRRFLEAQPNLFSCLPRAMANPSEGTLSVMVEPAAT